MQSDEKQQSESGFTVYHDQSWSDVMAAIEKIRPEVVTLTDSNGAKVRLLVDWSGYDEFSDTAK